MRWVTNYLTQRKKTTTVALIVFISAVGILVPILLYVAAFQPGIIDLQALFSSPKLAPVLLLVMIVGGVIVYWQYFTFIIHRPQWMLCFCLVGWQVVEYINNVFRFNNVAFFDGIIRSYFGIVTIYIRWSLELLENVLPVELSPNVGIVLSEAARYHLALVAVPGVYYLSRYGRQLFARLPYFKYYLMFFVWLMLYFFFNNHQPVTPRLKDEDIIQVTSYFYSLVGLALGAIAIWQAQDHRRFFDRLNKALLIFSSSVAVVTIISFPFNQLSTTVEGSHRATGLFTHPNPFAHHTGVLLIYLIGLYYYYQGVQKYRMPRWLLVSSIALNLAAFLLGGSKTAIGVLSVCAMLILLMNMSSPIVRRAVVGALLIAATLVPIGIMAYELIADRSFLEILEAWIDYRDDTLGWRVWLWGYIVSQMDAMSVLLGNGLTASNNLVFHFQLTTGGPTSIIWVHNAYVGLLYDLGIIGYVLFLAALSLASHAVVQLYTTQMEMLKPLLSSIIVLTVYFLAVCAFDEMTTMFDAPILYWTLATIMFASVIKESRPY